MNILKNKKTDWIEYLVLAIAVVLSVGSYLWSCKNGYTIVYNDAMSHLNISRLVIDNIEPSLAQIGSVWLPLNHVLNLTLIWNNWAWHSGFAGSIFSMLAYVVSVWGMYKIVFEVTDNKWAGFVGAMAFALNLNMLYLQTTPLTEPLYIAFFILSALAFLRWINTNDLKYLLLLGFFGFLQVLIRYDGWFVVGIEFLVLLLHELIYQKEKFGKMVGKLIIFTFPIAFGIGLWLLWNFLIFGDPLFFAFGNNSAHAQQDLIEKMSGLITKHNWLISFKAYWYAVRDSFGEYLTMLSLFSVIIFFVRKNLNFKFGEKILLTIILLSPFVFNVLALYLGFSAINMPELHWSMPLRNASHWFNVRYGVIMLPCLAFFVGIIASVRKKFMVISLLIFVLVICQNFFLLNNQIVLSEGVRDFEVSEVSNVAKTLTKIVHEDEKILISTAIFSSVLFKTGFPLKQFIHEGVSEKWPPALESPNKYAEWIVMREDYAGEPVYESLVEKNDNKFLHYYKLLYKFRDASIYKRRTQNEIIISTQGKQLMIGKNQFIIKGVNSYDLAYKSREDIIKSFEELSKIGVNTIRFWAFGDGHDDGFQLRAGIMNGERFERMDLIIAIAEKYNIRLIPVLVNNWDDYGGKKQYLEWTGNNIENGDLFFSEEEPRKLFKNYIDHIVPRKNTITGHPYTEEPAILSWELMNEPRLSFDKQEILQNWTQEMSSYIKQIDKNHLVSIGSEEEIEIGNDNENKALHLCALPNVDICSVHLYLFNKNKPVYGNFDQLSQFLGAQFEFSQKENKPILLGEFGVSKQTRPFDKEPLTVIGDIIRDASRIGYNGYLLWNWSPVTDDSFGFSFQGFNNEKYDIVDLEKLLK